MAVGVIVHHTNPLAYSSLVVVEVPSRPYPEPQLCPTCRTTHFFKAVHLHLDGSGNCVVSVGVLDLLKLAGLPNLVIVGHINNPPTLTIARGLSRQEVDFRNRRQTIYNGARHGSRTSQPTRHHRD